MISKEFSIITVSLNTLKHFKKTISSINSQTYKDYEIIVIDGLSNDGTINEIKKKKNNISKKIIEKDRGIYDAMNKGVKVASGKWIIFMNSGDTFYNKNVLKELSKFCLKYKYAEIIFGDTLIDNNYFSYFQNSDYFKNNTILMPFCHQSSAVKSILIKKFLFDKKYNLSSDFNFFLNCYLNGTKFLKFNKLISKVKAGGNSDIFRQKVFTENIKIFLNKKSFFKVFLLCLLKLLEFLKNFLKLILTKKLIMFLLKLKYNANILK